MSTRLPSTITWPCITIWRVRRSAASRTICVATPGRSAASEQTRIARGYVASRGEAFARFLDRDGPAFVPRPSAELVAGVDLLHTAGAAVVLAHPGIRGISRVLTGEVVEMLAAEHGLEGLEVDYPLHDPSTRDLYHRLGARLDLVRTGASDHHGAGKVGHELGSFTTREPAYRELIERISARGGVAS